MAHADYLYTGQRYDATTEQYYLRAREYDPTVGRFLSQDKATSNFYPQNPSDQCSGYPLVSACGLGALNGSRTTAFNELNRYIYSLNNPLNFYDPSGNSLIILSYGITTEFQVAMVIVGAAVVVSAIAIVFLSIYLVTDWALNQVLFAKGGNQNKKHDHVQREAEEILRAAGEALTIENICKVLRKMYQAARKVDKQEAEKIKQHGKAKGCINSTFK